MRLLCWKDVKGQKRSLLKTPLLQGLEKICGGNDGWYGERGNTSAARKLVWSRKMNAYGVLLLGHHNFATETSFPKSLPLTQLTKTDSGAALPREQHQPTRISPLFGIFLRKTLRTTNTHGLIIQNSGAPSSALVPFSPPNSSCHHLERSRRV